VELVGPVSRRKYIFTMDKATEVVAGDAPSFRATNLICECDQDGVPVTPGAKRTDKPLPKSYVKLSQKDDGTLRSDHLSGKR
jgi:hypothetical protein